MRNIKNLSFAVIFLLLGYFINSYKIVFYWKINSFVNYFKKSASYCIAEIKDIPDNSLIIVGHAYGSPIASILRGDKGISPKLNKLFEINRNQINQIVFSGDILHNPSLNKWNTLFTELNNFKLYVAPGNHDVGLGYDNAKRDIFQIVKQSYEFENEYPHFFLKENSLFIIDDSNLPKSNFGKILEIISANPEVKKIFIIRHHILTKSMSKFSNGLPLHPLIEEGILKKEFQKFKDKEITFIYGDGGNNNKTSLNCKEIGNTKHIINGIGGSKDDKVLVIKNSNVYFKFI